MVVFLWKLNPDPLYSCTKMSFWAFCGQASPSSISAKIFRKYWRCLKCYRCFRKLPHYQQWTLPHLGTHVCIYHLKTPHSTVSQETGMKIKMSLPQGEWFLSKWRKKRQAFSPTSFVTLEGLVRALQHLLPLDQQHGPSGARSSKPREKHTVEQLPCTFSIQRC